MKNLKRKKKKKKVKGRKKLQSRNDGVSNKIKREEKKYSYVRTGSGEEGEWRACSC